MYTVETSKHFVKKIDEKSGAPYYVLNTRVASQQWGFYFVCASMSDDLRYLWFDCAFPPAQYTTRAVIDFLTDEIHYFPETDTVGCGRPLLDTATGELYFPHPDGIFKRSPNPNLPLEKVCDLPPLYFENHQKIQTVANHMTFSPDKKKLFLDAATNKGWFNGALDLTDGSFKLYSRPQFRRNHGQFNPVYPGIALTAEEFHTVDGVYRSIRTDENGVFMRLWTVTEDGSEKCWAPLNLERATHEWWSTDGTKIYYCKYNEEGNNGICAIDYFTGEHKLVAPVRAWHGFSSKDDQLFVFDENDGFYRGCASKVGLYNVQTGKSVYFNSDNSPMAPKEKPLKYHLDPHPRFNGPKDEYIVFTTVEAGKPQLAVANTEDIVKMTL